MRWSRSSVSAVTVLGFGSPEPYSVMVGPMMVVVGLAPMAARHFPGRKVTVFVCTAVLVWAVASIAIVGTLGRRHRDPDVPRAGTRR